MLIVNSYFYHLAILVVRPVSITKITSFSKFLDINTISLLTKYLSMAAWQGPGPGLNSSISHSRLLYG